MTQKPGPLDGLKVLDFTTMMSGPLGTRLLADMGADVVKVEAPGGDHNRTRTPIRDGMSRYFAQLNAGKRSIVLDLKSQDDLELARRLAVSVFVIIDKTRPGVMSTFGLGFEDLSAGNQGLVYCSISGYGQQGPLALSAAYAPNLHASSGFDLALMSYQPSSEQVRPATTAIFIADVLAGIYATTAIEAALLYRRQSGRGQYIDVALFDAMLNLMVFEMQIAQTEDSDRRSTFGPLPTLDRFISVTPVSQKQIVALLPMIGHPEWIGDPRFATTQARDQHWDQLMAAVAEWTSRRTSKECLRLLGDAGVAVACYRTPVEALRDPQLLVRGLLAPRRDGGGEYYLLNPPFVFSDGSVFTRGEAPQLGADRDDIIERWIT
jgi:CoA:oxalate CoA-transferase